MTKKYILNRQSKIAGHDLSKCFFYGKRYTVPITIEELDEFSGTDIPEYPQYIGTLFEDINVFFVMVKERAIKRRKIRMLRKSKL